MTGTLLISLSLLLSPADTLSAVEKSAARACEIRTEEGRSATAYLQARDASYTSAALSWNGRREAHPRFREEGRGLQEGRLDIRTLVRLDSLQAVRGAVRYTGGVKKDVLFSSSSDYFTVYPYVVADTVGGDVRKEEYFFSGGYAGRRGRFHWGLEGGYRALHEFRKVDPRPRNIVSDLEVRGSAAWRMWPAYHLELTLGYRRYSQTQTLSFLSERGKNSAIFHLTGLGGHFARFAGATDSYMNTRYAGNGLVVEAALRPFRQQGWNAIVSYSLLDLTHYLPNLNQVPYTELYTREIEARCHYLSQEGDWAWKAGLRGHLEWRQGQESVLDNGNAGYLQELGRFTQYNRVQWTLAGSGAAQWQGRWTLQGHVRYLGGSERYAYPGRSMATSGLEARLGAGYRHRQGHWLLSAAVQAGRYQPLSGSLNIPEEYTIPSFTDYYRAHFARLDAASWDAGLHLHAERQLTRQASLYVRAVLQAEIPQAFGPAWAHTLSMGINF